MQKNNKRILVTGGTGFIGSALVKRLVKEEYQVRVLDSNIRGRSNRLSDIMSSIEYVNGDIRDYKTVEGACLNIDTVFHLAYLNGTEFFYTKPDLVLDIGVKGMVNIIDACIENKVKDFILASTSEVYQTPPSIPTNETVPMSIPDPLNPRYSYGGGKIICELMAINFGRKYFDRTVIFRPHNVYGPDMGWEHVIPQFSIRLKELKDSRKNNKLKFPIQGSGKETRSFIYIDDFTDALMILLEKGENQNIYHIGTEDECSIIELANQVASSLNLEIEIIPGELQKGGTPRRCPDITKMRKLGFEPKITLSQGLIHTVPWYMQNEKPDADKSK